MSSKLAFVITAVLLTALCASAQSNNNRPIIIEPFSAAMLDHQVDPCTDFYRFACGKWRAANPIPADQSRWSRFDELAERNREILRDILEKASKPDPKRTPVMRKIGDFYASCMDEQAIERKGLAPLKPELDRIANLKDKSALPAEFAHLQRAGIRAGFSFSSDQDFKDATQVIAVADQGGLGLPERDYYFRKDEKSTELRKAYVANVQRMFELAGDRPEVAAAEAKDVLEMETALAQGSLPVVERRDPANVYHKMTVTEFAELTPAFAWDRYLKDTDTPSVSSLNVATPEFFKAFQTQLDTQPLDKWKTYLRWHLLHSSARMLPEAFVEEDFNFYGKTLTGQKQLRPRWKRCVAYTDLDLGEALGQPYVAETFGPEGKQRTLEMVQALEKALGQDIQQVTWMTDPTKKQAEIKLDEIANKIGYPDKWRDYSKLEIVRGDALGNWQRGASFEFNRELQKIGKPVDKKEWNMSPPTVNAYYDPQLNDINFPAGILQPPFFDKRLDDAVNYGGIGAVIGHELTHGFDDEGRQFDGEGNLRDWWTPADAKAFDERSQCLVDEYSKFVAVEGVHVNGKLTLGENTADNGGLRLALMALENELKNKEPKPIDGFTPEQRIFLGWGQIWCENISPEMLRMQAQTNPHSPAEYRVNGVLVNMPEFQKAFNCKQDAPMVNQNACRVW
jgi:putative endopeptidase